MDKGQNISPKKWETNRQKQGVVSHQSRNSKAETTTVTSSRAGKPDCNWRIVQAQWVQVCQLETPEGHSHKRPRHLCVLPPKTQPGSPSKDWRKSPYVSSWGQGKGTILKNPRALRSLNKTCPRKKLVN